VKRHKLDKVTSLAQNLKYSKEFLLAVEELRGKWEIRADGFDEFNEFKNWQDRLYLLDQKTKKKIDDSKARMFENDVIEIMSKKLDLNPALDIFFMWFYVVMNEKLLQKLELLPKSKLRLSLETGGEFTTRLVVYNVSPLTNKDDWAGLWNKVEEMKAVLFSEKWINAARRYRVMYNEDIAKFILEKKRQGLKDMEIAVEIKEEFGGKLRGETDVSKMRQRFSNKVKRDTLGNT
jgi:hypothetical protein